MKKNTLTEIKKEKKRERERKKEKLGCKFIRINPDAYDDNCNIIVEIGKIQNHIIKSTKNCQIIN